MLNGGYFHHPTIAGETVVFVCEDDLWSVPAAGGPSVRLTANLGDVALPALSPNGRLIAFTGQDELHPEVYVMDAEGGPATRLTWLGTSAAVRGWTSDGQIIFFTDHGAPFPELGWVHRLAPTPGAAPERRAYGPGG